MPEGLRGDAACRELASQREQARPLPLLVACRPRKGRSSHRPFCEEREQRLGSVRLNETCAVMSNRALGMERAHPAVLANVEGPRVSAAPGLGWGANRRLAAVRLPFSPRPRLHWPSARACSISREADRQTWRTRSQASRLFCPTIATTRREPTSVPSCGQLRESGTMSHQQLPKRRPEGLRSPCWTHYLKEGFF